MSDRRSGIDKTFVVTAVASAIVSGLCGALGAVCSVDPQGKSGTARIARMIFHEELQEVSVKVAGALCTQAGANVRVVLSGFPEDEKMEVYYRYLPSKTYSEDREQVTIDHSGRASVSHNWYYGEDDCPSAKLYHMDVVVHREHATSSTQEDIVYEAAIPTRNE
ncbi:MAG: hypothetical protein LKI24_11820 [Acidipropionibacterium sp.]|nr:hypothetical protein [Acidipropionibacterium sp.]